MLKLIANHSILRLREILGEIGLAELMQSIRPTIPFENPWPRFQSLKERITRLPQELQPLYRLLLLGEDVFVTEVSPSLERSLIHSLEDIGFLVSETEGSIRTNGYIVVPYDGFYFIADVPPVYPTHKKIKPDAYIDTDTLFLARMLPGRPKERVLDICTGAGLLAIVASASAAAVIATDINPLALNVARFNAILNGVDKKIAFNESDLFETIARAPSQMICANPPYLAVPQGIDKFVAGDGGEDGMRVVFSLLKGVNEYLAPDGYALIMGGNYGDHTTPNTVAELRQISTDLRLKIDVFLLERMTIQHYARSAVVNFDNPALMLNKILEHGSTRNISHFYILLLRVSKSFDGGHFRFFDGLVSLSQRAKELRQINYERREQDKRESS